MKYIFSNILSFSILLFLIWERINPSLNGFGLGMMYFLPFLSLSLLFVIIYLVYKKSWKTTLLSVLVFMLSVPFLQGLFSFNTFKKDTDEGFSVLSYNSRVFNIYKHLSGEEDENIKGLLSYSLEHPAEIKCFQEYFNADEAEKDYLEVRKAFENKGYHLASHAFLKNHVDHEFGLAICSKFDIKNFGVIELSENKQTNGAIYADIAMKGQTIRVYNIHLESFGAFVPSNFSDWTVFMEFWKSFTQRYQSRVAQSQKIIAHIEACPYPVILCGDLNDVPHAYSGRLLSQHLSSSFEKKGYGFGFTLNKEKLPFFRIDQQFFSEDFKIHDFQTLNEVKWTDHFPIEARYSLK